jgi:hypothetical protein
LGIIIVLLVKLTMMAGTTMILELFVYKMMHFYDSSPTGEALRVAAGIE